MNHRLMPCRGTTAAVVARNLLLAAVVAAPLAACGGTSEEDAVREVVAEYLDQVGEQDYAEACGFLADSLKGGDCQSKLRQAYASLGADSRQDLDNIDVSDVAVNGSSATVLDTAIRVAEKHKTTTTSGTGKKKKKKTKTTTTYRALGADVTAGNGFILTSVGDRWKISAGV